MPAKFDLQKAIAGEPIQTRDGRKARFIAHVPEAPVQPVVAHIEGERHVELFDVNGNWWGDGVHNDRDIFMATRKRQLWVRAYRYSDRSDVYLYQSGSRAELDIPGPRHPAFWLDDAPRLHGEYEIGDDDA